VVAPCGKTPGGKSFGGNLKSLGEPETPMPKEGEEWSQKVKEAVKPKPKFKRKKPPPCGGRT